MDPAEIAAIGDEAEAIFDRWSRCAGFATAGQVPDRFGIDRWFELPALTPEPAGGLDHRVGPASCHLQVKGTTKPFGSTAIALTVWERFAKSDLPCFILGVELTRGLAFVRAHLVHVDEREIARVLRRLREQDAANASHLHLPTMRVRWTHSNAIGTPPAEGFLRTALEAVGDRDTYAARKRDWRQKAGYGKGGGITAQVNLLAPSTEVVQALLGNGKRLPVEVLRATETRFGIERPAPGFSSASRFEMELEPPRPVDAELIVQSPVVRVAVRGKLLSSLDVGLPISGAHHVWRFESTGLRLDITPSLASATLSHRAVERRDDPAVLRDLRRAADIIINLLRTDRTVEIVSTGRVAINFEGGVTLEQAEHGIPALCCRWASLIAEDVGLPDDIVVTPASLFEQAETLQQWGAYLDKHSHVFLDADAALTLPDEPVMIRPYWVSIGEYVAARVLAFHADEEVSRTNEANAYRLRPAFQGRVHLLRPAEVFTFNPLELPDERPAHIAASRLVVPGDVAFSTRQARC